MTTRPKKIMELFWIIFGISFFIGCGGGGGNSAAMLPQTIAPVITTQPASQTVMVGQTATFTVTATGTAPLGYQWRENNRVISGATSASFTTPATTISNNGAKFTVVVSNGAGSATSIQATLTVSPVNLSSQISQHGITWTFDKAYRAGRFINGDWWVQGPVTMINISPASTVSGARTINGSMINPSPQNGNHQGYDSAMYANEYEAARNAARPNQNSLSAANPLTLPVNSSLISTISIAAEANRPQLKTAAILTVLAAPPPAGSFRPPYCGTDKTTRYNISQLNYSLLQSLTPTASTPTLAAVERYFERPWIDHIPGWSAGYQHPEDNMPNYGREIATQVGIGALMLHLNFSNDDKRTLLIRYIQLGIDLYGIIQNGGINNWEPDGGHASGRKWPILFAGLMLDDAKMKAIGQKSGIYLYSGSYGPGNPPPDYIHFGEDGQTFYVTQADVDREHTVNWEGIIGKAYLTSDIGMPEWGIRHSTDPGIDNKDWTASYRQCCTAHAWPGFVLAAHMMNVKSLWNYPALFDYQDRYMTTETPHQWMRCWDRFTEDMWDTYRADY